MWRDDTFSQRNMATKKAGRGKDEHHKFHCSPLIWLHILNIGGEQYWQYSMHGYFFCLIHIYVLFM